MVVPGSSSSSYLIKNTFVETCRQGAKTYPLRTNNANTYTHTAMGKLTTAIGRQLSASVPERGTLNFKTIALFATLKFPRI